MNVGGINHRKMCKLDLARYNVVSSPRLATSTIMSLQLYKSPRQLDLTM